jgi:hypothetical protein
MREENAIGRRASKGPITPRASKEGSARHRIEIIKAAAKLQPAEVAKVAKLRKVCYFYHRQISIRSR